MLDLIPTEVATCATCGGVISLGERLADTLTEDVRRWHCLAGHEGTIALTMRVHRDHALPAESHPIAPRRYMTTRVP